ncbi:MAG: PAS domain S-box protein [Methanoregula sp.]|nr:PAS domain S-box protein [Methanoregula sp.]
MDLQFSPVVILFLVTAAITAALAVISWRSWKSPIAPYLTLLFAAATIWNLGDAGEFLSIAPTAKFYFVCMEYPGMVAVPVAWFFIVLCYTGNSQYLTRKTIPLFFLIPVLTVTFVLTNPLHHLYYISITSIFEQGLFAGVYVHGPLFWIHIGYSYALSVVGLVLVLTHLLTTHSLYRRQMALLLVACAIPLVANIVYVAGWGPYPHLDLAPLLFTLSGLIAIYGISRYSLLSFMPVAYSRVFQTIADGVIVVDDRGAVSDVNPAAEEILGFPADRIITQPVDRFFPPALHFPAIVENSGKKDRLSLQEIAFDKSGLSRYYEASFTPFDSGFPGKKSYLILLRDITRRKQAQSALAAANKKINLMASITRHDILNQITALDCYIELNSTAATPNDHDEYLDKEKQIISKIQEQIEFTREYQSLGEEAARWQDLRDVLTQAIGQADPGKIRIIPQFEPTEIFADPMLEKVFFNLIDNAAKYGEKITRVTFTGKISGREFRIICEDDGVGIPDEDKLRLFTRGFGKHTGLGLFLSREILSITGLTITETGIPGNGARFEILVPPNAWRIPHVPDDHADGDCQPAK